MNCNWTVSAIKMKSGLPTLVLRGPGDVVIFIERFDARNTETRHMLKSEIDTVYRLEENNRQHHLTIHSERINNVNEREDKLFVCLSSWRISSEDADNLREVFLGRVKLEDIQL